MNGLVWPSILGDTQFPENAAIDARFAPAVGDLLEAGLPEADEDVEFVRPTGGIL